MLKKLSKLTFVKNLDDNFHEILGKIMKFREVSASILRDNGCQEKLSPHVDLLKDLYSVRSPFSYVLVKLKI